MSRKLSHDEAAAFYDRLGKGLDTQSFYEDPATGELILHGDFGTADYVVDFGCGTGRLAKRLLTAHLPQTARLLALDVSARMVEITSERLAAFGERVQVVKTEGGIEFPLDDEVADRVISTYVLDVLTEEDERQFIREARRVLQPGGLLCLASLTEAQGPVSGVVCTVWKFLHRIHPVLTGGCRPVRLLPLLGPDWVLRHHRVMVSFGVPSEILIAERAA